MGWLAEQQVREEARKLLTSNGRTVLKVIRVELDSRPGCILYLGASSCPMTGWVWTSTEHGRTVLCEPGFPAYPDPDSIPEWALESYFAR